MGLFRRLLVGLSNFLGRFIVPGSRTEVEDGRIYPRDSRIAPSARNPYSEHADHNLRVHCDARSDPSGNRIRHGTVS